MRRRASFPVLRTALRRGRIPAAAGLVLAIVVPGAPAVAQAVAPVDQWTGRWGDGTNSSTNAGEHVITAATASKVRQAWSKSDDSVNPFPPVVLGGVAYSVGDVVSGNVASPVLKAVSPKTGATLWSLALPPGSQQYTYGIAGTGHTVLISFSGQPGGVLAVNTTSRKVLWKALLPPSTITGFDNGSPGVPYTDGTRLYVSGSSNAVNAYSLASGARLWSIPITFNPRAGLNAVEGFAVGNGTVFTASGPTGGLGLVAYSASTGKQIWRSKDANAFGIPVIGGSRVFVSTTSGVAAYPAGGCGSTTCGSSWTRAIASYSPLDTTVATADAASVFVTHTTTATSSAACGSRWAGNVTRLSAATGAVQWHVSVGDAAVGLVRGGDEVWLIDEFWNAGAGCVQQDRILGYPANATGSTPSVSLTIPTAAQGFPQELGIGSGTLFESTTSLIAYRVPGT